MINTEIEGTKKKVEGIFSIVSGLSGIAGFILDYPSLAFALVLVFGIVTYFYLGADFERFLRESKSAQSPRIIYWFNILTSNRVLGVVSIVFVVIIVFVFRFTYKEIGFILKQGWVEKLEYEYQTGMLPVHLVALDQANRSLDTLRIINPVIYYDERFNSDNDEISFEARDYPLSDYDIGEFDVYAAGYDPQNSILEPLGQSDSNLLTIDEFKRFPFQNKYTFFVVFINPESHQPEYIRLHFVENSNSFFTDSSIIRMNVFVSHLSGGRSRFDGLINP